MRNNEQRLQQHNLNSDSNINTTNQNMDKPFSFPSPKQLVVLPSKGKYYPESHPYFNKESIEIYYMTASEEDILTNQKYLEHGLAFDKLINNLLVEKVDSRTLHDCDRTAILIQARRTGFGDDYKTNCRCPECNNVLKVVADLENDVHENENLVEKLNIINVKHVEENIFEYNLKDICTLKFKVLNGFDDVEKFKKTKKKKKEQTNFSDNIEQILVSVNDHDDPMILRQFSKQIPLIYALELIDIYSKSVPSIVIKSEYECESCDSVGVVEVPFTQDFFWPNT